MVRQVAFLLPRRGFECYGDFATGISVDKLQRWKGEMGVQSFGISGSKGKFCLTSEDARPTRARESSLPTVLVSRRIAEIRRSQRLGS